jgi:hypothetical protein
MKLVAKRKTSLTLNELPLNHPELVDQFRGFLGEVGRAVERRGGRLLIGIDELDRISDGEQALRFLNELKAVFEVPNCLYLVTVSDDALADFELAAMGVRTAFDSAFDDIIRVDYLTMGEATVLLQRCMVDVPMQFVGLAHVLSGGLARELLRIADIMSGIAPDSERGRSLPAVARLLAHRQLRRTTRAAMDCLVRLPDRAAGAVLLPLLDEPDSRSLDEYASQVEAMEVGEAAVATKLDVLAMTEYLATLVAVFDHGLDERRMGAGHFETLTRARRYLGANPYGARHLVSAFRDAWRLGE